MADVFVSYVRENRAIAEKIAGGLSAAGFSVWWDRHIRGGAKFAKEIERELSSAKVVLVLWSSDSLGSEWVRDEAEQARNENKLIPVCLDGVQPPLGFRQSQSLDFSGWSGDATATQFAELVDSARHFLGHPDPPTRAAPGNPPAAAKRSRWGASNARLVVAAAIVIVVAGAVAVLLQLDRGRTAQSNGGNDGRIEISPFEPLTKTEELERFAKGVTDTIVRVFATSGIKTVARADANAGSGPTSNSGAEFALRGTVDREGTELIVGVDILHRREGLVMWSTTTRGAADAAQALQQQSSVSVASALGCAFLLRQGARNDSSAELFAKFLRVCAAIQSGQWEQVPELARQIVESAPQYAVAYALQAYANANLTRLTAFHWTQRPEAERERLRELASDSAKTALEMDSTGPSAGFAYYALAIVWDPAVSLAEKERRFQKALSLNPENVAIYYDYAEFLLDLGRIGEARSYLMRGLSVAPLVYSLIAEGAYVAAATGDIKAARDQLGELKAKAAYANDSDVPRWFEAESRYGDPTIARQMATANPRLVRTYDDDPAKDGSGCLNAFLDARANRAQLSEDQVEAACAYGFHLHPLFIHAYFGHTDWVFNELRNWDDKWFYELYRGFASEYFLPGFRAVRADPRFMPFMEKIGRVDYWLESNQWPDFCKTEKLTYDCKQAALAARAAAAHDPAAAIPE